MGKAYPIHTFFMLWDLSSHIHKIYATDSSPRVSSTNNIVSAADNSFPLNPLENDIYWGQHTELHLGIKTDNKLE